jgi:hypothetical protein
MKMGIGLLGEHVDGSIVSVLPIGAEAANTSVILHARNCEIMPPFEKPLV